MTDWQVVELDPLQASTGSLPARIVVPQGARELEEGALTRTQAATWAEQFSGEHPDAPLTAELQPLVRKEPLWQQASGPLEQEDFATALPLLEQIVAIDPSDAAARFNRASAYRNLGRPEQALDEFGRIEQAFAQEGVYHANVGRTLEELGREDDAAQAYERSLELLPGDAFVLDRLAALGRLVLVQGAEGEPLYVPAAEFEEAVRSDLAQHAEDGPYLRNAAAALLDQGRDDVARNAAQLALAVDENDLESRLYLSVAFARLGRLEEALAEIDRHLAGEPASAVGHLHRAQLLYGLERREEAEQEAERTLELDPNALPAAQLVVAGDDGPEAALERARALVERTPGAWAPLHVAGDLSLALGDEDAAVELYEQAVELGAADDPVRELLGELGRRGRIDDLVRIADSIPALATRDPGLRWNVAAGYTEAGRTGEARIVFASIAHDESAPPDLRAAAEERVAAL